MAHEDDPARALHAALKMMDRLSEVNKELIQSQGVSLEMRIGINTGEVLAYTDPQPGEPMVTGDVVNVASRLQTAAEPGRILVAERTAKAVRRFNFNEVGELQLRGKSISVRAFELIGWAPGGSERGHPGSGSADGGPGLRTRAAADCIQPDRQRGPTKPGDSLR